MTREEAKLTLQENFGYLSFEHPGRIAEAIKVALEALSKPPLPSNLDEAAEEYANRGISSNADPYEETIAYRADKEAFKAGAEWMAGHGGQPITSNRLVHTVR